MTFQVDWTARAKKDLSSLPQEVAVRIARKLEAAKENPDHYLHDLAGRPELKLRVGDYRVLCGLNYSGEIIQVKHIDHRNRIYKR